MCHPWVHRCWNCCLRGTCHHFCEVSSASAGCDFVLFYGQLFQQFWMGLLGMQMLLSTLVLNKSPKHFTDRGTMFPRYRAADWHAKGLTIQPIFLGWISSAGPLTWQRCVCSLNIKKASWSAAHAADAASWGTAGFGTLSRCFHLLLLVQLFLWVKLSASVLLWGGLSIFYQTCFFNQI